MERNRMQLPPETAQLRFREWMDTDRKPFRAMTADPEVMRYFPSALTPEESDQLIQRIQNHFREKGFGFYAVEKKDNHEFIGFIGFFTPRFESFFTPCVEIGWRLSAASWGKGYATEGAIACLEFGFSTLGFQEVYSFTSILNKKSENVMIKSGMKKMGEFEHPLLAAGHILRKHVLYRKTAPAATIS